MANTKTGAEIILEARELAGIEGLEDRFPDAQLMRWLNQVIRKFRVQAANIGLDGLTVPTAQLTLPTVPPIATERFLEIPLPDGAVSIYGVDVLVNQQWEPLVPGSFATRRDYQTANATFPSMWHVHALPTENGASLTAGKIMLWPLATGGLPYRIWYLAAWVDVTNLTFPLYGHDMWHEWWMQGLVRRICQKDNDAAGTLDEAKLAQAEAWKEIKKAAVALNRAQPVRRVRARRRRS